MTRRARHPVLCTLLAAALLSDAIAAGGWAAMHTTMAAVLSVCVLGYGAMLAALVSLAAARDAWRDRRIRRRRAARYAPSMRPVRIATGAGRHGTRDGDTVLMPRMDFAFDGTRVVETGGRR